MAVVPPRVTDMRLLVIGLAAVGPAVLAAHLESSGDAAAGELAELLRQEGHLLTGGLTAADIALTLESRLAARPGLLARLGQVEQARPARGLLASHAPPDRDDPALLRSIVVALEADPTAAPESSWQITGRYDIDWHPDGDLLAVVNGGPTLQIVAAGGGMRAGVVEVPGARMGRVRWSPDGARLAVIDGAYRRPAPKWNVSDDSYNGAVLSVCDPLTGAELDALKVSTSAFCWAPDSASLAIAGGTGVWLWQPGAAEPPRPLPGETIVQKWGDLRKPTVDQSPDEDADLLDDDLDWRPRLLDQVLDWHPGHGLLAHARGSLLRWADPHRPEPPDIWPIPRGEPAVYVQWRPGGYTAALATGYATMIVDPVARQVRWSWPHGPATDGLRWAPDGSRLAVRERLDMMGGEALLRLWHIPADAELEQGTAPTLASVIRLGPEHLPGGVVTWRPDGTAIAATETRRLIKLWPTGARPGHATEDGRPPALSHVTWNPDGTELAVRARDSRWFHLDPADPHAGMRKCAPHPYTRLDPAQRFRWLHEAGVPYYQEPPIFEETSAIQDRVEFAPDERTYAWIDSGKHLRVINPNGDRLLELDLRPMSRGGPVRVCFTSDGAQVIAAGRDNPRTSHFLARWPVAQPPQKSPAAVWRQHDHPVEPGPAIGFVERITASRTHLAVIAYPRLIGLFALADMRHLCWIRTNAPIHDAAFDPAGHRLAVVGDAGLYLFAVHDPDAF